MGETRVYNIALIGAGQFGSRHLQGLARMALPCQIEVVEPDRFNQQVAFSRFQEVHDASRVAHEVSFVENLDLLSDSLDLVIVATNADVRARLVDELLQKKQVGNLLLEKVLFQSIDDYDYFQALFAQHHINVWVNHPRRLFTFYNDYIDRLKTSKEISYHVQGGAWGLASNSLHYLDHIQSFARINDHDIEMNLALTSEGVIKSKRSGSMEVFGSFSGRVGNCSFNLKKSRRTREMEEETKDKKKNEWKKNKTVGVIK